MEELYKKNEIENLSFEQILEREGAGEEETNETVGQTLYDPDVQTTHLNNILLGNDTGRLITTGTDNTFVGFQAGFSNTTGYDNFFAGSRAGYFNTAGYNNCFIGSSSGQFTITGYDNIAIGNAAMQGLAGSSGDGHDNTIMGFGAGYMLTSGHNNITVGNQSLGGQNTPPNYMTGSYNVCMGKASGAILTSGLNNVFLGTTSGYKSTSGYDNVYIGNKSGYFGTGHNNVYLGGNTGYANQTGSDNVFLGFQAGYYETGSNKFFLDSWARGNEADARVKALMYGIFASTTANQHLYLNSNVYISDTLTIGGTAISSLYQPLDSDLTAIAGLSSADSNFIVGSAGGWVAESGATARTSLGLGTGDSPTFYAGGFGVSPSAYNAVKALGYWSGGVSITGEFACPDLTMANNGENYGIGLRNVFQSADIASGKTDIGYRRAADMLAHINDADFEGTLSNVTGLFCTAGIYAGTGIVTNAKAIEITRFGATGTVTNSYGLYINAPYTGGTMTNKWAMYINDPELSYWVGTISALTVTDRTKGYSGDAVAELKKVKNKGQDIDHSTIPQFARVKVKVKDANDNVIEQDGRDLGAMISILTVAVQQLTDRIEKLESNK